MNIFKEVSNSNENHSFGSKNIFSGHLHTLWIRCEINRKGRTSLLQKKKNSHLDFFLRKLLIASQIEFERSNFQTLLKITAHF